jgi:signal transduction histidine kinase
MHVAMSATEGIDADPPAPRRLRGMPRGALRSQARMNDCRPWAILLGTPFATRQTVCNLRVEAESSGCDEVTGGPFARADRASEEPRRLSPGNGKAAAAPLQAMARIAIVAHDLRTPLASVGILAASLERDPSSIEVRSRAGRISRMVKRMQAMISDLLDFSRAAHGVLDIERLPIDLCEVCRDVVDEARARDATRRVELHLAGELYGSFDHARVYQAISNLVGNAVEHGSGAVIVRAHGGGGSVEVRVWNEGATIPADILGSIFEPFERGGRHGRGLGLGLYIVREIARAHGGTVSVASTADSGTTFTLALPSLPLR